MKIFITGAAGFIGSHLVKKLVNKNFEIIAHDNLYRGDIQKLQSFIDDGIITFFEGDIRSYDQLRRLMSGAEIVFHLAAQSNVIGAEENMDYSFETNVIGTYNVLKAAQSNGVKRLIFTSSREVYGEAQMLPVSETHPLNAKNTYGVSKVAGEKYVGLFNRPGHMETIIFRLANVYGSGDKDRVIPIFIHNILNAEPIRIYGGKQIIDFVSIEIVVEALLQSIHLPGIAGTPINVGSGKGTDLYQLAARLKTLLNSETPVLTEKGRSAEVEKYTADIQKLMQTFKLNIPEDPLYHLDEVIRSEQYGKSGKD